MNKLNPKVQTQVVTALVEGASIRATCRMTGVAKGTVISLLERVGEVCRDYQDKVFRNLPCKRIQCDEIWSFCHSKEANTPKKLKGVFGYGDVWTWTALDADTKLVPSWHIGRRDAEAAKVFMEDLAARLANRVQLTTDGHKAYIEAVEHAFGSGIEFSQLVKLYGPAPDGERRYSPPICVGIHKEKISGKPNPAYVSTSFVERQNLTMQMQMRRFTRLTNGFSKKVDNLSYAVALYFMYYNFCRIHQTLRVTPAMAAKVSKTVWSISDIVKLLDSN